MGQEQGASMSSRHRKKKYLVLEEKILKGKKQRADVLIWIRLHDLMSLLISARWLGLQKCVNKSIHGVL